MRLLKLIGLCCVLALVGAAGRTQAVAVAAEEKPLGETKATLKEMPLLGGDVWQAMTSGEKIAFVWGVGHVVTMEREIAERRPELKKKGFAFKVSEGLAGMPMNEIVSMVDGFYAENPGLLSEPVMKVIWDRIVKPRIKAGFVDEPKE